jgi:UDP-GlcNAc:undecaprenyl-phosphate GlcNAc-1-phosphate transferase
VSARDGAARPFTLGKIVVAVFAAFLLTEEGRRLLFGFGPKSIYLLLLSFSIAYTATPLVLLLARRVGAIDNPGGTKTHEVPAALLGGVAIYAAFVLTVLHTFDLNPQLTAVILAGTLLLIVGLVDDLWQLSPSLRLLAQLVAVGIVIRYGVVVTFLPTGFLGSLAEYVITAIWIVGITNAFNFLDGMDGLAAGSCCISAVFFGLVGSQHHQSLMVYLSMPLAGACLGFLPYNFRRRRSAAIFMGDAGSTFIGFMMACLGLMGQWAGDHVVRLIIPILILGMPIFDTTFTTCMRVKSGQVRSLREWVSCSAQDHVHDRLAGLRIGRPGAVLIIYVVTVWLGLSALTLEKTTGLSALLQVGQSIIVFLLLGFFMVFVQRKYAEIEREIDE